MQTIIETLTPKLVRLLLVTAMGLNLAACAAQVDPGPAPIPPEPKFDKFSS